jgi:hypothetical protein
MRTMEFNQNLSFDNLKTRNWNAASVLRWLLHLGLFLLTFFTTTIAGVLWLNRDPLELSLYPVHSCLP